MIGGFRTLQAFSNLLLMFPGGILADTDCEKRVIVVSSLFSVVPLIIFLYSSHWTTLAVGILVSSLSALGIPAQNALIAESLPQEKRAMGFGFYTMAWYLFIVVAYPFGGYLMDSVADGVIQGMEALTPPVGRKFAETIRQIKAFQLVRASEGTEATPAGWEPGQPTLKPGPALVGNVWQVWQPKMEK